MQKRYVLQKDLPNAIAGDTFEPSMYGLPVRSDGKDDDGTWPKFYSKVGVFNCLIPSFYVKNKEWFCEEHICQHCGAWTSQPDEECYKAPGKEKDEFLWTDELVEEFAGWYKYLGKPVYDPINTFKQSKTTAKQATEFRWDENKIKVWAKIVSERYSCGSWEGYDTELLKFKQTAPVKEEKHITVRNLVCSGGCMSAEISTEASAIYSFTINGVVPDSKQDAVKKAIEEVLNDKN